MLTIVRRYWPFLLFAAIALVHVVQLAIGAESLLTKTVLMPSLLAAVLLAVLVTARSEIPIETSLWALGLLEIAILAFWLTDLIFSRPPEVAGIAASGVAHMFLIALFLGPLRVRWRSWLALPYAVLLGLVIVVLVPGLGALTAVIVAYAVLLAAMAYLATRVNALTGVGAGLFVLSAILKAALLFLPGLVSAVPISLADAAVMALYCAGIGLIALGTVRRLAELAAASTPLRRRTAVPPRSWARTGGVGLPSMR